MSIFTIYKETKRNREALLRLDLSLSLLPLFLSLSLALSLGVCVGLAWKCFIIIYSLDLVSLS